MDSLSPYCKKCIREKVATTRKIAREYKEAQRKLMKAIGQGLVEPLNKAKHQTPSEKVLGAIRRYARTQAEIAIETKLSADEIGDALADLLLRTGEIRTQTIGGRRMYFENKSQEFREVNVNARSFCGLLHEVGAPVIKG